MATDTGSELRDRTSRLTYILVFVFLAVITAVEVVLASPAVGIGGGLRRGIFILLSFSKAALVAAFYMHLRSDSRLYTYIFLIPVVLLIVFAYVMALS
jgi:caa(3)-type oxidase subunit IV